MCDDLDPMNFVGSGGLCRCNECLCTGLSGGDGASAGCSGVYLEVGGCFSDDYDVMLYLLSSSCWWRGLDLGAVLECLDR